MIFYFKYLSIYPSLWPFGPFDFAEKALIIYRRYFALLRLCSRFHFI